MKDTCTKNAHLARPITWRLALTCSMLLLISGCGVDSGDGEVRTSVELPTDNVLNLYCADIGLNNETCVLDDPDNPYARTPFTTGDPDVVDDFNTAKFALARDVVGNPKATFYVYATALARAPSGENQWYTARALHELYTASGSDLIKNQAIRAYRSNLDNFFDSATFFVANFLPAPPPGGIAFPVLIRELTAADLAMTPTGFTPLFFPADAGNNEFFARETMGGWGYTWLGMLDGPGGPLTLPGPVEKN
jgi:hypothetical protein